MEHLASVADTSQLRIASQLAFGRRATLHSDTGQRLRAAGQIDLGSGRLALIHRHVDVDICGGQSRGRVPSDLANGKGLLL